MLKKTFRSCAKADHADVSLLIVAGTEVINRLFFFFNICVKNVQNMILHFSEASSIHKSCVSPIRSNEYVASSLIYSQVLFTFFPIALIEALHHLTNLSFSEA